MALRVPVSGRLEATVASGDALDVRHFHASERMNSLFEIAIVARSENPDIDFEGLIGQKMSFSIRDGIAAERQRAWSGVCSAAEQIAVEDRGLSTYRFTLVPELWLASQRRNHRMFQLESELDIALQVLSEWQIEPEQKLSGACKKRKHRVQYGETDYAFICRMLEDAGISFYFIAEGGETKMVLSDGPQRNEARKPIAFRDRPTDADEEHVTSVRVGRMEAKRAASRTVTFETNAVDLAPGSVLSFLDHPKADLAAGKNLLVLDASLSGAHESSWTASCTAVSADQAHRPALDTPKPKTNGVESATVVGPTGEEIHTDELGRVRVHFHWDREPGMDDSSSCWIHVSQPWGGAGFGGTDLPRVGQEVIVDFLGGDPDRPIIIGRGAKEVGRDDSQDVSHDRKRLVGNDETVKAGDDERLQVKNDRSRLVGNNEAVAIGNDRSKVVGSNEDSQIGANQSLTVGANQSAQIGGDRQERIGGTVVQAIGQNMNVSVTHMHKVTVGDVWELTVGASKIHVDSGGNVTITAQNVTVQSGGPVLVEAGGNVKVQAGGDVKIQSGTVNVN
jgi:uncharacterized protein involved in type VI secretion and phage assembly